MSDIFDFESEEEDEDQIRRIAQEETDHTQFYLNNRMDDIQLDIQQLALYFRTLYEICLEKEVFTKSEFKSLLQSIDGQDGAVDGRISPAE